MFEHPEEVTAKDLVCKLGKETLFNLLLENNIIDFINAG
jgi:hypothetical protein